MSYRNCNNFLKQNYNVFCVIFFATKPSRIISQQSCETFSSKSWQKKTTASIEENFSFRKVKWRAYFSATKKVLNHLKTWECRLSDLSPFFFQKRNSPLALLLPPSPSVSEFVSLRANCNKAFFLMETDDGKRGGEGITRRNEPICRQLTLDFRLLTQKACYSILWKTPKAEKNKNKKWQCKLL